MRRAILSLFVAAVVVLLAPAVGACSCIPPGSPQDALNASDAVFSGTVERVAFSGGENRVLVDVSRVWKGPSYDAMMVSTAVSSAACGYNFNPGEDYLVYASTQDDGDLSVSLCSRTARLQDAQEDVAALGDGERPAKTGLPSDGLTGERQYLLLAGVVSLLVLGLAYSYRRD